MSEEVRYVAEFLRTKLPAMLVRFGATVTMIGIGLLSVWGVCSAWFRLVTRYEATGAGRRARWLEGPNNNRRNVVHQFIIPALFAQLNQSTIHQISKGRAGVSRLESHLAAKTGIDRGQWTCHLGNWVSDMLPRGVGDRTRRSRSGELVGAGEVSQLTNHLQIEDATALVHSIDIGIDASQPQCHCQVDEMVASIES
ncbi:hypothetical protein FQN55_007057 [Onygenales sp. PD_40]|nr:hypothetical protein FQN55_007057 [Onygenales sp. PD_40]